MALLLAVPGPVRASWGVDGNPVCSATGPQSFPSAVTDGSGGAVIVWADQRNGNTAIYAQRIDSAGTNLWTLDGVAVVSTPGFQSVPLICSDGAGGAIVVWTDDRTLAIRLYAQRVDVTGNVLWPGGTHVCSTDVNPFGWNIVADGFGGAIIAWVDRRGPDWDIYSQRLNSSGAMVWPEDGVPVCTQAGDQTLPGLVSDGAGAAVIAWIDKRNGANQAIYAQGLNFFGTPLWLGNGTEILSSGADLDFPEVVADGFGGAVIAWQDARGSGDIYAQRVNAAGATFWAANGNLVGGGGTVQTDPVATSDGSGGAIIAWQDWRTGKFDIYAQNIQSTGATAWTANGVEVSGEPWTQENARIISDGAGGAVVVWEDGRNTSDGPPDIYAQRVDYAANKIWPSGGIWMCGAANIQQSIGIAPGASPASPIVAWQDFRDGAQYDIYALRVILNTQPGMNVMVAPIDENSGEFPVEITFDQVLGEGVTTLATGIVENDPPPGYLLDATAYNVETTAAFSGNVEVCITYSEADLPGPEPDLQLLHYEEASGAWSNVTSSHDPAADMICGMSTGLSPFVLAIFNASTGVDDAGAPERFALHANWPNPFNPETTIEFDVPDGGGHLTLRVFDTSGSLVRTLVSGSRPGGRNRAVWAGRNDRGLPVGSGVYFYRLTSGDFSRTRKMVLLK